MFNQNIKINKNHDNNDCGNKNCQDISNELKSKIDSLEEKIGQLLLTLNNHNSNFRDYNDDDDTSTIGFNAI